MNSWRVFYYDKGEKVIIFSCLTQMRAAQVVQLFSTTDKQLIAEPYVEQGARIYRKK